MRGRAGFNSLINNKLSARIRASCNQFRIRSVERNNPSRRERDNMPSVIAERCESSSASFNALIRVSCANGSSERTEAPIFSVKAGGRSDTDCIPRREPFDLLSPAYSETFEKPNPSRATILRQPIANSATRSIALRGTARGAPSKTRAPPIVNRAFFVSLLAQPAFCADFKLISLALTIAFINSEALPGRLSRGELRMLGMSRLIQAGAPKICTISCSLPGCIPSPACISGAPEKSRYPSAARAYTSTLAPSCPPTRCSGA